MISLACQAQQGLERSHRRIPAVKAENKFIKVMLQVFGINAVVGTIEPSFEIPEGAMNMLVSPFLNHTSDSYLSQRDKHIEPFNKEQNYDRNRCWRHLHGYYCNEQKR